MTPWFDYPKFDVERRDVIVIGAGIAGCQMTWHLSQLGWRVTLIEREADISTQASGNLAGVISPKMTAQDSDTERFYQDAFFYTTQQLDTLNNAGVEVDWQQCGMLQLGHNPREFKRWQALKERDLSTSLIQLLDKTKTSELAGISIDYPASYFPEAGFINPASFCHGLLADSDYQLFHATDVIQLHRDTNSGTWEVLGGKSQLIASASTVVICNGKDLNQFKQTEFIPLANVLGQTSLAKTSANELKCVIGHEGYLTPSYKGMNVFGATFERDYSGYELSTGADQRNLSQLQQYLPVLTEKIQSVTSGHAAVRPATPDRYPFAGGVPNLHEFKENYADLRHGRSSQQYPSAIYQHGLFILGGLGSRGLTTSAYCAHLLSKLISNRADTMQSELLKTLHPARFLIRQLKRGAL